MFLYHPLLIQLYRTKCVNQYDIRLTDQYPECGLNWPYELPLMSNYLNVSIIDVLSIPPLLVYCSVLISLGVFIVVYSG